METVPPTRWQRSSSIGGARGFWGRSPHRDGSPSDARRVVVQRRRGRDSNPREASTAPTRLAGGRTRPLCDPPKPGNTSAKYSPSSGPKLRAALSSKVASAARPEVSTAQVESHTAYLAVMADNAPAKHLYAR